MQVGFIGLGNMGAPLARRLCADHTLWVFDQSQTAVDAFAGTDAQVARSAAELAESVDIVLTCLPTSGIFGRFYLATSRWLLYLRPVLC